MSPENNENQQLPSDRATAVLSLVEVAEGAVVSRVLARTTGGSVTLFAFDRGQQLSEHTAPFDALVQVVDGSLELTIGESYVEAGAGDVVLMPADVPHALRAQEPTRMLLTMLKDPETEE
jgi:quercetin dioxygenase-like cupin family protein